MTRKTRKRRQPIEPWKPPPDAPPLREVIRQIVVKNRQLSELDDDIGRELSAIEEHDPQASTGAPRRCAISAVGKARLERSTRSLEARGS